LFERVGRRDPRRHDEAAGGADLAEREQHLRVRFFQDPAEGAVVDGNEFVLDRLEHLAHGIARRPTGEARDRVLRQHRLAVVKLEPGPQAECPSQAVRRHLLSLDHLALRLQGGIDAVKHVPDQQAGVARDIGAVPNRIEIGEVRMRR
jgi:hypothetical protein